MSGGTRVAHKVYVANGDAGDEAQEGSIRRSLRGVHDHPRARGRGELAIDISHRPRESIQCGVVCAIALPDDSHEVPLADHLILHASDLPCVDALDYVRPDFATLCRFAATAAPSR